VQSTERSSERSRTAISCLKMSSSLNRGSASLEIDYIRLFNSAYSYQILCAFSSSTLDKIRLFLLLMLFEFSTVALVMAHCSAANALKICLYLFNNDLFHERALLSVAVVYIDEKFPFQIRRHIESLRKQWRHDPLVYLFEIDRGLCTSSLNLSLPLKCPSRPEGRASPEPLPPPI